MCHCHLPTPCAWAQRIAEVPHDAMFDGFTFHAQVADAEWSALPLRSLNCKGLPASPSSVRQRVERAWHRGASQALGPMWSLPAQNLKCVAQRRLNELCPCLGRLRSLVTGTQIGSAGLRVRPTLRFIKERGWDPKNTANGIKWLAMACCKNGVGFVLIYVDREVKHDLDLRSAGDLQECHFNSVTVLLRSGASLLSTDGRQPNTFLLAASWIITVRRTSGV